MQAEAKAEAVRESSHQQLRPSIFAPYLGHTFTALGHR